VRIVYDGGEDRNIFLSNEQRDLLLFAKYMYVRVSSARPIFCMAVSINQLNTSTFISKPKSQTKTKTKLFETETETHDANN